MGLETGTYLNALNTSWPLPGDKKKEGDDHFRLIKLLLTNTFPNASRAFRFETTASLGSGVQSILASHDRSTVFINTSGGDTNLFLPVSGIGVPFIVNVVKGTFDTNRVFVQPVSGSIFTKVGGLTKVRIGCPYELSTFLWDGSSWARFDSAGEPAMLHMMANIPTGWQRADGTLLAVSECPELFVLWNYGFGGGGAVFGCPNLTDRFPVAAGSSYAVGSLGGEATHVLSAAEMPSHFHAFDVTSDPHHHPTSVGGNSNQVATVGSGPSGAGPQYVNNGTLSTGDATVRVAGNTDSRGSGAAHENRPPYYGLNFGFRLC